MTKFITTDARPHFIPGIYSWLAENFTKVYLVICTDHPKFVCPAPLPLQDRILPVANPNDPDHAFGYTFTTVTLNFGVEAVSNLRISPDGFSASMRFNQRLTEVFVPFEAIHSVYAPENMALQPFTFVLLPGQEKYCKQALNLKKTEEALVNGITNTRADGLTDGSVAAIDGSIEISEAATDARPMDSAGEMRRKLAAAGGVVQKRTNPFRLVK